MEFKIELLKNIFSICMGLIVGSFVNVLVARLPHGESVVTPRSRCPSCKKTIAWYDNIPLFSYIALRGKCRGCREAISIRYPVIELMTATLFLAARIRLGWSWLLFARDWPFVTILVAITFIDLEHRIIPDKLSIGGVVIGLATAWAVPGFGLLGAAVSAAVGFGIFYFFAWAYQRMTGRSGLGGGDIKLLGMLGAFVGLKGIFITILVSSVFGSLFGVLWAVLKGRENIMKMAIPYGPFLVVGALYWYLLGNSLWFPFTIPT